MQMATVGGIVGLVFAGVVGLPIVVASLLQLRNSLDVGGTEWQDVVDLDGGYAKLQARAVEAEGTVTAPLSGRECLAVETAIQRYRDKSSSQPGRNMAWIDDHTVVDAVPFDVEDPTGSVSVEPTGADWSLETDYEHLVAEGEAPTGPHAEFVANHDVYFFDDEGVSEAHELKFVERRVEPGDEIAVFGPCDDSGIERQIQAEDGRFVSKLFSMADDRDDLTQTASTGVVSLLFGLVFVAGGLGFTWLAFT